MNQPAEISSIRVRDIDHLGIVAGIVDDIGLFEKIDHLLGTHPQEHLSCGQAVKAMILNGLGFLCAPLYLFEEFFVEANRASYRAGPRTPTPKRRPAGPGFRQALRSRFDEGFRASGARGRRSLRGGHGERASGRYLLPPPR